MRKKFREPCKLVGLYVPLRHMEQMEEIQTDFEIEIKRKSGNGAVPDHIGETEQPGSYPADDDLPF